MNICLLVSTEYTNVADEKTPHDGIGCAYAVVQWKFNAAKI